MASAKLLVVLACVLTFAASGSAQNFTNPNITNPVGNVTVPPTLNPFANATLPPVLNGTATPQNVSNATLAIYRAVRVQSLALLGALQGNNILGLANYVTPDVQLFLPNTTGPVGLANATTLLPFLTLLTPPAGTNTSLNNVSELYFYVVDNTNVAVVDEVTAGQLGNVYITSFWSLINGTNSPINGSWLMNYATIVPAPAGTYIPQPTPLFVTTPNITLLPSLNTSNINVNGTNRTATLLNSTLPTNVTIRGQVVDASNALAVAFGNLTLSPANVSSQFFAPWFQVVLPGYKSPAPLNLTDPTIISFITVLNATGTAAPQVAVAYRQLNTEAAILTTLIPALPGVGDVYATQLWQYLNASSGSNTTTGINTTIPTNSSRSPLAKSWQLTLGAINLAPNSAAPGPIAAGAPVPAPAPTGNNEDTPAPTQTSGSNTPSPTPATSSDTPSPTQSGSDTPAPTQLTGSDTPAPTPSGSARRLMN